MTEETQPWPRSQRMPLAIAGGRPQPWHHQAIANYDEARGETTEMRPTIPGGYTASEINEAIVWWNKCAELETAVNGAPLHQAISIIQTLVTEHAEVVTAFAEHVPAEAQQLAQHLADVTEQVDAAVRELVKERT